ncbi:hypothetical protein WA75_08985 [Streptococcus agalactiae]|uniref:PBECR4 domain-containing protein n=1 Tax=Streptococcus agalactiae TaxID=1311 RepID=UPI0006400EB0|nr:PBECR4 domain-containing protein [Streptococcus agalactiae]KLK48834.1 hypothetical protein WA75_08985 [Streptococcus agalactiae]
MPLTKAQAKSLDILEVARSLGMEMKRKSHREYYWAEHDSFKIDTVKNTWHWYSQADKYGDTINLVQEMRNVSYKEAMVFLETGSFPEAKPVEEERKPFNYTLAPYEQRFVEARSYLKEIRGLSDDTIDFFLEKGVLAQAKRKDKGGVIEDVLVFKYLDRNQQLVGASLQGLVPDQERHPGKGYLKQIMYQSESISGLNVSIGSPKRLIVTEAPIDLMSYYELHKGELNDVRLVAMEGLKEGVLSHYVLEILQERGELTMDERDYTKSSELTRTSNFLSVAAETSTLFQDHKYDDLITLAVDHDKAGTDFITKLREKKIPVIDARPPKHEGQEKTDWNEILKQTKQLEKAEEIKSSSHFPDTSHLSPEDATWLKENWNNIGFSVEPRKQMVIDSDKTVTYEKPSNPLGDGREPKKQIQSTEKAPENSQEQMNDRTSGGTGSLQPKAEGSTSPVLETSTFEQTVTSHPTSSYPYLQFSTNYDKVQRRTANYHPITPADLRRLNQYAPSIQSTASWYLNELADSKISFVYADHGEKNVLQVTFQKDNFIHLSGIRPFEEGKGAANFLDDIANGQGHYDGMLISNAIKDKLQVLPMLRDILDPHSFVLDDLSSVEKLHNLNMSEAIKAKDEDFLLLFKDIGDEKIPASLMKLKGELATNVKSLDEKIILGVYRERDGHIEQLSVNEEYVKDKGAEMLSVLKNKQYEEVSKEIEQTTPENTLNKPLLDADADGDGVSDEEELIQGTNPYDFRSKPGSKPEGEDSLQADEIVLAAGSLAVADFIQNKDMAGLSRHLKEGIKEFLNSDKYKDYLTKMSQLNNYSNRNLRLILAQNPEARQVASFKQWKENFGRYVKKGEKALRIFKPMTKIKKDENNQPILDKNGKPETVTFFGLVPVFDVSQTEGKEMPKAAEVKEQLTDLDYANLYRALMAIAKENDVSVRFEEMENNKHGYYSVPENQIVLRSNEMNKAQIIKTFLHEMAHAELHHADNPQKENLTRSTAELQAESVAYVVSSYYGIDTSEYSFNYLSGWSADKETLADLEAQLDIVQQEAKSLMVRMDQALEQLRLSQEKQTKPSFEQKLEKFKDQSKQAVEEHKQELKADAQSKKEKGFSK